MYYIWDLLQMFIFIEQASSLYVDRSAFKLAPAIRHNM